MISFEHFEMNNTIPIYLQIIQHIKRGALSGEILDGDELPSRRNLSALLGVNPNTVQKAYRMLEEEGLIRSSTGAKSSMLLDTATLARIRTEMIQQDIGDMVRTLKRSGISREQLEEIIDQIWKEEEA